MGELYIIPRDDQPKIKCVVLSCPRAHVPTVLLLSHDRHPGTFALITEMGQCWERFKMGALMGGTVGACIGAMFGTFAVLRHGHGGNGFFPTIGKIMLQSGASFGLFMGIGGLVRCDDGDANDRDRLHASSG